MCTLVEIVSGLSIILLRRMDQVSYRGRLAAGLYRCVRVTVIN